MLQLDEIEIEIPSIYLTFRDPVTVFAIEGIRRGDRESSLSSSRSLSSFSSSFPLSASVLSYRGGKVFVREEYLLD